MEKRYNFKIIFLISFIFVLIFIPFSSSTISGDYPEGYSIIEQQQETIKVNQDYHYTFIVSNSSTGEVLDNSSITCSFILKNPNGNILYSTNASYNFNKNWNVTISSSNISQVANYPYSLSCTSSTSGGSLTGILKVTKTGEEVTDLGLLSTGILYFLFLIGALLTILGYLFLDKDSIWTRYFGVLLMILGFAFLYYDLNLGNLYATTIAYNSGAENTTEGAFLIIIMILKLTPYIMALLVAFTIIKLLRASINRKRSSDGWDNNNY